MRLDIYEPAYYTKEYGSNNEISDFCRGLSDYVKEKKYSELIEHVRIGPIVAPEEILSKGLWKEKTRCWPSSGDATVNRHIDFLAYKDASIDEKKAMLINTILQSVQSIKNKGKFQYKQFETDVLQYCSDCGITIQKQQTIH